MCLLQQSRENPVEMRRKTPVLAGNPLGWFLLVQLGMAQNVGIGTISPQAVLHVQLPPGMPPSHPLLIVGDTSAPLIFVTESPRRIGIGTYDPQALVHITYRPQGAFPYFRSITMGPVGGWMEGEYIGWNAILIPDSSSPTSGWFVKLGGGTGYGWGEQRGGALIFVDAPGNMHFQTYRAGGPGKDTLPDTIPFQPSLTLTYQGDLISYRRGGYLTGVRWTPIQPRVDLGSLPLNPNQTTGYDISAHVPPDAVEVLVYCWFRTGANNADVDFELRIYTREGSNEYSHYLFVHGYNQGAWSYNSSTFWLPVTSDKKIWVSTSGGSLGGNRFGRIYLLGYR